MPPKPFPEAMAYSIIIDDVTYYNYILLRTIECFEDGTVVFTNKAQDIPFQITIRANHMTGKVNFTFAITGRSNLHLPKRVVKDFLIKFTKKPQKKCQEALSCS